MKTPDEIVSLSFFSGCGGLDLGLELAGIRQRLVCDFDKHCRASLALNWPTTPVLSDLLSYSTDEIRSIAGLTKDQRPNLIVGGPPCQAFSTAGNRKGFDDPRGNVFLRYIQLIEELQPDYAVIENVRGLLSAALKHRPWEMRGPQFPPFDHDELRGGALLHVTNWLEKIGYGVSFNLYNSANFGVPQTRERVVLIASRDGSRLPFLTPTHSDKGMFGLQPWVSFKEAVDGLDPNGGDYVKFPEDRLKYYRLLGPGEYWKNLPEKLQIEALGKSYYLGGGKTGFLRRVSWDKPCPTLVTHPAMPATDLAHPVKDRPLSIQEYKRIQMLPDDWHISGTLIQQYKQIGNAVPVGLGKAIGTAIINHINKINPQTQFNGFQYSRYKNTDYLSWRNAVLKELGHHKNPQGELRLTA